MGIRLPERLAAGEPGWATEADVVVVGSGIAGLTAALRLRDGVGKVLVVTKDVLSAGSTQWAQGGIAAALGPGDTPAQHEHDTLVAGAGACDLDAVRALVTEGPEAVRELIALGANFDHSPDGVLSLTREGGHHRDRIAHAGGDATGAEIQRALVAAVQAAPDIPVIEHALALDLIPAGDGGVARVSPHVMGGGQQGGGGAGHWRAGCLASGGRRPRREPPRHGGGPAGRGRRGPLPRGRPRQRRARTDLLGHHEPAGGHRGRDGARAARRRGAARPGLRAVPPPRDVARTGLARP